MRALSTTHRDPSASIPRFYGGPGQLVSAWLTDLPFDWGDMPRGTRTRTYANNETLFLEGQDADTVYLIREGRVRLTSFGVDGKERHLMILGANGLVGDCALHSAQAYVVSAVAATDTVACMVPIAVLQAALSRDPRLAAQHQALSSMRFRVMLRHVAAQGSNTSRRRVCLHLLDLVNSYGVAHESGTAISIAFTQQEMGSICGLSRVSVSHIFTWLAQERVITRSGRLVVVVDVARLTLLSRT
jgi:CRP/FNR family transcriptional regulator